MEPQPPPRAAHASRPFRAWPGAASGPAPAAGALLASICVLLAACSYSTQKPASHLAVVIRIEQPEGMFYSPRMQGASRPLTKVYLRPSAGESAGGALLVVAVLGPYEPRVLGEPGDVIALIYSGPLRPGTEIPFEDLTQYEVIAKAPRPRT